MKLSAVDFRRVALIPLALIAAASVSPLLAADCRSVEASATLPLGSSRLNGYVSPQVVIGFCHLQQSHGFEIPDPSCTPGSINPTVTLDVLTSPEYRTSCTRDRSTRHREKEDTYVYYNQPHPNHNFGPDQLCELDHLVPLELGGADTLDNIWPQCSQAGTSLAERPFKRKDTVENYLAWAVKSGQIDLSSAQKGIAADWTQYLAIAESLCPGGRCPYQKPGEGNTGRFRD